MKKHIALFALTAVLLLQISCSSEEKKSNTVIEDTFIRAADISFLPLMESEGTIFYNNGAPENMITTLKSEGCNAIRIRLWKNPVDATSSMSEVKVLAQRVKQAGMKVWLTVHYSDTWADPGNQQIPAEWQGMSFNELKVAVAAYTAEIITEIDPDIMQIGNETNNGFLWPHGKLTTNENQFIALLTAASETIRSQSPDTKIMLHYADPNGADWFFDKVKSVDYDYIGLSYYPIFHGKNLTTVKNKIASLGALYNKKVIIAETAYPFTLGYNDFTNNLVGLENQLIPTIPATPEGQRTFMMTLKNLIKSSEFGGGFAYWGAEWVAFRGPEAQNGSSFENQALYDFENKALPVMEVFNRDEE